MDARIGHIVRIPFVARQEPEAQEETAFAVDFASILGLQDWSADTENATVDAELPTFREVKSFADFLASQLRGRMATVFLGRRMKSEEDLEHLLNMPEDPCVPNCPQTLLILSGVDSELVEMAEQMLRNPTAGPRVAKRMQALGPVTQKDVVVRIVDGLTGRPRVSTLDWLKERDATLAKRVAVQVGNGISIEEAAFF
ncbi:hypothetical protein OAO01_05445 [Oligoflexia bacterium]|nr:hypothetical protein [Oligoflexia bacterium]